MNKQEFIDFLVKRDDLSGKEGTEMRDLLVENSENFKKLLDDNKSYDEVQEFEKIIIDELNAYDEHLKTVSYKLPKNVTYDEKTYSDKDVYGFIVDFVERRSVDFANVLGLYQMVKFWKGRPENVNYHVLDSTLRVLNLCEFKGMEDWRNVLVINEFVTYVHKDYSADVSYFIYLSTIHDTIMKRMKLLEPQSSEIINE